MPLLSIDDIFSPQVLAAEKDYLLVYKPPRMHSAPLAKTYGENVLSWCAARFPEIALLPGRKAGEGGLLHRLDYETQGLMLIARNSEGMEALLEQQRDGKIIKEYSAMTAYNEILFPGFPKREPALLKKIQLWLSDQRDKTRLKIESAFIPYGPGRKAVRPFLPGSGEKLKELYSTVIIGNRFVSDMGFRYCFSFRIRIRKGFRHQIRCHLAWLGLPILNDRLYGGPSFGRGLLALRAASLEFIDPSSGEEREYSIPELSSVLV